MLQEKINQLQKQLGMFTTLPLTNNFYETIQLNSCNLDDIVLAVYSEEYGSYKVIHKTSSYLHFVYSAVFKNFEQKLSFKNSSTSLTKLGINNEYSSSPNDQTQLEVQFSEQSTSSQATGLSIISNEAYTSSSINNLQISPSGKNQQLAEISENSDNIFSGDKQPQWFVGKVLVKEFCVARKVFFEAFYFFEFEFDLYIILILKRKITGLRCQVELAFIVLN